MGKSGREGFSVSNLTCLDVLRELHRAASRPTSRVHRWNDLYVDLRLVYGNTGLLCGCRSLKSFQMQGGELTSVVPLPHTLYNLYMKMPHEEPRKTLKSCVALYVSAWMAQQPPSDRTHFSLSSMLCVWRSSVARGFDICAGIPKRVNFRPVFWIVSMSVGLVSD